MGGDLRATRRFPGNLAWRVATSGGDTLISLFPRGSAGMPITRQAGSERYTLATLPRVAKAVTLSAEGSPSLRLAAPFTPRETWTNHSRGGIVVWDGQSPYLERIDREGQVVSHLPLPTGRYPVSAADQAAWADRAVPSGDMAGRGDIFKSLRAAARDQASFPDYHSPVYELIGGPDDSVWIRPNTVVERRDLDLRGRRKRTAGDVASSYWSRASCG